MALIDKLSAIAEAIRDKTGKEESMTLEQMVTEIGAIDTQAKTYILVDDDGNEYAAVLVDEPVEITATANDIRLGTTAVTGDGVTKGMKRIPSYETEEGYKLIPAGHEFKLTGIDKYDYTKLLAVICIWNANASNSVATEKVVINDNVYVSGSTEMVSTVTCEHDTRSISLGFTNDTGSIRMIRYMTYKEVT